MPLEFGWKWLDLTEVIDYSPVVLDTRDVGASEPHQEKIICNDVKAVHVSETLQSDRVLPTTAWEKLGDESV